MKCEYCKIPGAYGDLIEETEYWMIFLAPSQRYLGTCVVALKEHRHDLMELDNEEWIDFIDIVRRLESALKKTFNPTLFNWSCFKNSTYRSEKPDPEIHWHFIPRYDFKIEFEELNFEDPDFGFIPQPIELKVPREVMRSIRAKIKRNLQTDRGNEIL